MKTISGLLLLLAASGTTFAQDYDATVPEEAAYPAPSVVYEAPVIYHAPVVYQAPVIYYAPVYYLTAAAMASPCNVERAAPAPSTLIIIGTGSTRVIENYGNSCGSTVFHFGGQQASLHGYRFGQRR